jgi:hypothetical protein
MAPTFCECGAPELKLFASSFDRRISGHAVPTGGMLFTICEAADDNPPTPSIRRTARHAVQSGGFKRQEQEGMRSFIAAAVAATIAIVVSASAHATSSLSFEADGYLIDIVVGDTSEPVVFDLSMAKPGSKQPTSLPMQLVKVDVFETTQRALFLTFKNPGDPALPASFRLTVRGDTGTLEIGEQSLVGRFSWGM